LGYVDEETPAKTMALSTSGFTFNIDVTGGSLSFSSGHDYTTQVPEPGVACLAAATLLVGLTLCRRYR
jgi:hypothetical protein